jgi:hypothetical protein
VVVPDRKPDTPDSTTAGNTAKAIAYIWPRVESTVDQLVDWWMEKKQHMRWTRRGAQMLLHARCALLNGELGKYTSWSPSESSQVLAVAA